VVVTEDHKAEVVFSFFDEILGSLPVRSCTVRLEHLDIPSLILSYLSDHFTEAKVWAMIRALPPDKAPRAGWFHGALPTNNMAHHPRGRHGGF
jgi:hypothetical protein